MHRFLCLGHHTSGVRKEFYRPDEDWAQHLEHDPNSKLRKKLIENGVTEDELLQIEKEAADQIAEDFAKAVASPEPDPATVEDHVFIPTPVTEEKGERSPANAEKVMMVDAAFFAIRELMEDHPEADIIWTGCWKKIGWCISGSGNIGTNSLVISRVFNTAIQEAYIVGSTVGYECSWNKTNCRSSVCGLYLSRL